MKKDLGSLLIALGIFMGSIVACEPESAPTQLPRPTTTRDANALCIRWTEAGLHDGQTVCVAGRIVQVGHEFDEPSQEDVWRAEFGSKGKDFALVSVGKDISQWQGRCVRVTGTLLNRTSTDLSSYDLAPAMVSLSDIDESNFVLESAPESLCGGLPAPALVAPATVAAPLQTSTLQCTETGALSGHNVTCIITRAFCSYQPKTLGKPTFGNDAPYPSHHFALVVWGQDWSDYDGRCLKVTG